MPGSLRRTRGSLLQTTVERQIKPLASDYTSGVSTKSIQDRRSRLDVARLCGHLETLHRAAQFTGNFTCNGDSLAGSGLRAIGAAHPVEQRVRHAHARHLI